MDSDSESPLNKAHRYHRKAEDYEKSFRFDSAIKCHSRAGELLAEALQMSSDPKAQESLKAQLSFHRNQETFLSQRKEYFKRKSEEFLKKKAELTGNKGHSKANGLETNLAALKLKDEGSSGESNQAFLETAIYRVFEEQDSLLQCLFQRKEEDKDGLPVDASSTGSLNVSLYKSGMKVPKGDQTVIEELRINKELNKEIVGQLLLELENANTEIRLLRGQVVRLESELKKSNSECMSSLPELPPLEPPKLLY